MAELIQSTVYTLMELSLLSQSELSSLSLPLPAGDLFWQVQVAKRKYGALGSRSGVGRWTKSEGESGWLPSSLLKTVTSFVHNLTTAKIELRLTDSGAKAAINFVTAFS